MKKGFTLIELVIYIAIAAAILLAIGSFWTSIVNSRIKNQVIIETEQQGSQVMQQITQTIRNAEDINSPTQGNSASILSLGVSDPAEDPTIFDLVDGVIRITKGSNDPVDLTSSAVEVTSLNFSNLSNDDTPGTIRVEFSLEYLSDSDRAEYDWSQTFYGSASLR